MSETRIMTKIIGLDLREVEEAWAETMETKKKHRSWFMAETINWVASQHDGIWTDRMKVYVGFLLAANFPPSSGIIEAGSIPE